MGEGLQKIGEFVGGIEKVWERVLGIELDSVFTQVPENTISFFFTMVHSTQGLGIGGGGSWRRMANSPEILGPFEGKFFK